MADMHTLDQLPLGQSAVLTDLTAESPLRQRMIDLGFVPGLRVDALLESPWGDPVAYGICGTVVALRREDARQIIIRRSPAHREHL